MVGERIIVVGQIVVVDYFITCPYIYTHTTYLAPFVST